MLFLLITRCISFFILLSWWLSAHTKRLFTSFKNGCLNAQPPNILSHNRSLLHDVCSIRYYNTSFMRSFRLLLIPLLLLICRPCLHYRMPYILCRPKWEAPSSRVDHRPLSFLAQPSLERGCCCCWPWGKTCV